MQVVRGEPTPAPLVLQLAGWPKAIEAVLGIRRPVTEGGLRLPRLHFIVPPKAYSVCRSAMQASRSAWTLGLGPWVCQLALSLATRFHRGRVQNRRNEIIHLRHLLENGFDPIDMALMFCG